MSFIQFESAREKERARQQIREAREELLEQAKRKAEQRSQRELQKTLSGEANWMHPSVSEKIDKINKSSKKKKDKKKREKAKKSKKSENKHKHRSSSCDASTHTDSDFSVRSDKKSKKYKRKHSHRDSEEPSEVASDTTKYKFKRTRDRSSSEHEWVDASTEPKEGTPLQRDSWMTDTLMLKTFTRQRTEKDTTEKQQIDAYDPKKSARELNPYWKSTGTGLPAFQKPKEDSDAEDYEPQNSRLSISKSVSVQKNWRKSCPENAITKNSTHRSPSESSESDASSTDTEANASKTNESDCFLTDQQMNELGAKILKAEIMGNIDLAAALKRKLEGARANRVSMKDRSHSKPRKTNEECVEEHILLTHTDERGNSRPLVQSKYKDTRDSYGGRRKQQKRVETHAEGERLRYFPDDDQYDIKQMFEKEKYSSAAESNLQFADIVSKHKNPNDDLEDIFTDQIRKNVSKADMDKKEMHRAIHEQQKMSAQLENCNKCFDSDKMDKKLLVSLGEKVYLALPWHIGLQPGHCIIVPTQHVSCCTQLDEDTWEEIMNFRKALTRMYKDKKKDVIFFEIANKLHKRPHLSIHCVPIPDAQGEMAPFYFKKAIEESEQEWSVNKQLVSLRNKGLRSSIPKGLPYFWVNFGMNTGFAHVIEDENRFPPNYAQEIIGGLLNLETRTWRKPQKEQNSIVKVKTLAEWWKKYDCTK